jgi:hypothetical protein
MMLFCQNQTKHIILVIGEIEMKFRSNMRLDIRHNLNYKIIFILLFAILSPLPNMDYQQ